MSKTIDTSDLSSLSTEDLRYLRDRGRLTPEQESEYLSDSPRAVFENEPKGPYSGTTKVTPSPYDRNDRARTIGNDEPVRRQQREEVARRNAVDEDVDYEEMRKEELQQELSNRGLATAGNKDELIARLEEDDENSEEEEDEEV